MTFNPDNLIFFYLTLGLVALAMAIVIHAAIAGSKDKNSSRDGRK